MIKKINLISILLLILTIKLFAIPNNHLIYVPYEKLDKIFQNQNNNVFLSYKELMSIFKSRIITTTNKNDTFPENVICQK